METLTNYEEDQVNEITMRTFVLRLEKAQKSPIALFD